MINDVISVCIPRLNRRGHNILQHGICSLVRSTFLSEQLLENVRPSHGPILHICIAIRQEMSQIECFVAR